MLIKKCLVCKRNFKVFEFRKTLTCSQKCSNLNLAKTKEFKPRLKDCKECGTQYMAYTYGHFCSSQCKMRKREKDEEKSSNFTPSEEYIWQMAGFIRSGMPLPSDAMKKKKHKAVRR